MSMVLTDTSLFFAPGINGPMVIRDMALEVQLMSTNIKGDHRNSDAIAWICRATGLNPSRCHIREWSVQRSVGELPEISVKFFPALEIYHQMMDADSAATASATVGRDLATAFADHLNDPELQADREAELAVAMDDETIG